MFQMSMCYIRTEKSWPRSSIAGLFALLTLAAMLPWAHGQTAQPTTSPVPTLILNAEEVSLDLVVHDKKNQAVLDLKPGEIAVFDAGSPVTLNSLRLVSGKPDSLRVRLELDLRVVCLVHRHSRRKEEADAPESINHQFP
jgi:hypothetical protein